MLIGQRSIISLTPYVHLLVPMTYLCSLRLSLRSPVVNIVVGVDRRNVRTTPSWNWGLAHISTMGVEMPSQFP